jgi:uncharacterized protein with PIN domain
MRCALLLLFLCAAFRHTQGSSLLMLAKELDERVYELRDHQALIAQWTDALQKCFANPRCSVDEIPVAKEAVRQAVDLYSYMEYECSQYPITPGASHCDRVLRRQKVYVALENALDNRKMTLDDNTAAAVCMAVSSLVIIYVIAARMAGRRHVDSHGVQQRLHETSARDARVQVALSGDAPHSVYSPPSASVNFEKPCTCPSCRDVGWCGLCDS